MLAIPDFGDKQLERYEALSSFLKANFMGESLSGAEIGIRYGATAEYLLTNHLNLFLCLVDPYLPYQDIHEYLTIENQNRISAHALKLLDQFNKRILWINKPSVEAATKVVDRSLDFVFIDAEHSEQAVYDDCVAWFPKVRSGGVLCGHDYCYAPVQEGLRRFNPESPVYCIKCEGDIWAFEVY